MDDGQLVRRMSEEIDARLSAWIATDNEFSQIEGLEWDVMTGELALKWGPRSFIV